MKIEPKLEAFLKEEGVLEKFIAEYDKSDWDRPREIESIARAFRWHETEDGEDFWLALFSKFVQQEERLRYIQEALTLLQSHGYTVTKPKDNERT